MKLLRYGQSGYEKPGLLDAQGQIRDLSNHIEDINWEVISPRGLDLLRRINLDSLPKVESTPRLGVPYVGISKFIGVGLNYTDHAKETNAPIPTEPIIFMKATTCISGPNDNIILPKNSTHTDWEVELAIVMGRKAQYVSEKDALNYVAGFCLVNDVSERHFQKERGGQWDKGKGCDTFGPIGPWLVTKDEIRDPQNIALWLEVNGTRYQNGNTKNMIFGCAYLVSYISQFMTLLPGDIITTGTPAGVAMGMTPPRYLKAGDTVELQGEGLGTQKQNVLVWLG